MFFALSAQARVEHLLPVPQKVVRTKGKFALGRAVRIVDGWSGSDLLGEVLTGELGCPLDGRARRTVTVRKVETIEGADEPELAGFEHEAYRLEIRKGEIVIEALSRMGVIRAAQTLQQLAEDEGGRTRALECVTVTDWPAFKVRGYMHDVGRSYITVEELEKQLRLMSRYKINVFQWHLTENQAWRFEVRNNSGNARLGFDFSRLTSAESMTRDEGRYYTQEECRRMDSVAHKYGIYIIPELDMPGHSAAFRRATGGVDMQSDKGVEILKECLRQCLSTFCHAPYIHIGGDEVAITYDNFLNLMTDFVHENDGRRVVWWNNCAGTGTTRRMVNAETDHCDMAQCWATSGRQVKGMPCIDCRYNYTNHFDVFADLAGIYRSNILGKAHGDGETAGFISCTWNDRKLHSQAEIMSQNNVYAVTIACGERAWKGGGRQYIEQGGAVLPCEGEEYEEFRDWERRFLFHKSVSLKDEPIPYVRQTHVRWAVSAPQVNGGRETRVAGAGIYLSHTWGSVVPGVWGKGMAMDQTATAYTYIHSERERDAHAWIEFQNYGRSENDPAPANGSWDRKGSDIWLNDVRIEPPSWMNDDGGGGQSETELRNENFASTERRPVAVHLRKGWNKVLLRLPFVRSGCRLEKWMFTFVLTDPTGRYALEDVIYSPEKGQ